MFLILLLIVFVGCSNAFCVVRPVICGLVRRDDYARRLPNFFGIVVII